MNRFTLMACLVSVLALSGCDKAPEKAIEWSPKPAKLCESSGKAPVPYSTATRPDRSG